MSIYEEYEFAIGEWSRVWRQRQDPTHPEVRALLRIATIFLGHMLEELGLECDIREDKVLVYDDGVKMATVAVMPGSRVVCIMSHLVHPVCDDWAGRVAPEHVPAWLARHRKRLPQLLEDRLRRQNTPAGALSVSL